MMIFNDILKEMRTISQLMREIRDHLQELSLLPDVKELAKKRKQYLEDKDGE